MRAFLLCMRARRNSQSYIPLSDSSGVRERKGETTRGSGAGEAARAGDIDGHGRWSGRTVVGIPFRGSGRG
jgi:hypothetical protein